MDKKGEVKKNKISPENFLNRFSQKSSSYKRLCSDITTSQLSDAMRKVTGQNGVLLGVKPLKSSFKIMGRATTVKTSANDWGTVIKGIYASEKGNILVISCDRDDPAVWGELASTCAQNFGISGTVVYGAIRDIKGIKNLDYPVFSRTVTPNAGNPIAEGEVNISVVCGRTIVNPGDIIMGDECGVVSVPEEIINDVIKEAYKILDNENYILQDLKDGKSFLDILKIE
ncbi:MAG: RraA family protein [Methanobacterium sp.]